MDAERLGELAKDVIALLKNYEIPAEKFVMGILVSREYYESINISRQGDTLLYALKRRVGNCRFLLSN